MGSGVGSSLSPHLWNRNNCRIEPAALSWGQDGSCLNRRGTSSAQLDQRPMSFTLVALAAGVGRRYGGLKQLEQVGPNGESLLEYSVYDALRAGFSRVILVVRPETQELFCRAFSGGMDRRVPVTYVHQTVSKLPSGVEAPRGRVKPWGTGQALLVAEPEIDGPFAMINADDFYGAESYTALSRSLDTSYDSGPPGYSMVGFAVGQTLSRSGSVSRALCELDNEGRLERIVEVLELRKYGDGGEYTNGNGKRIEVPGDAIVSMNMWGFTPALFPELRSRFGEFVRRESQTADAEFLVPKVVQDLIREGRALVEVVGPAGTWCGITYPEDRERAARTIAELVARGDYPSSLWDEGV